MFILFRTEGTSVLFDTYVSSDHKLENSAHIVLADGKIEWDAANVTMYRNISY